MECLQCNTYHEGRMQQCGYKWKGCQKYTCKPCLRKWFKEHKDDKEICRKGPQCSCGEPYGFSQPTFYTKRENLHEMMPKNEIRWLQKKLEKEYDWSKLFAKCAIVEYIQFMKLKIGLRDIDDKILAPSGVVECIWVEHIDNPEKYFMFCTRVNHNNIIHRESQLQKSDDVSIGQLNEKYSTTLSLLSDDSFNEVDIWSHSGFYDKPIFYHRSNGQFFVKTVDGNTKTVYANLCEPVTLFKYRVRLADNTLPDKFRLIFAGRQLEDWKCLDHYRVERESTFWITYWLR
jgi:hypothetical protein